MTWLTTLLSALGTLLGAVLDVLAPYWLGKTRAEKKQAEKKIDILKRRAEIAGDSPTDADVLERMRRGDL